MPDSVVLRSPLPVRVMFALLFAASLAQVPGQHDRAAMATCAVIFGVLFLLSMNRWVVDLDGVERRFPLRRRDRVPWREVLAVGLAPRTGNLVLTRQNKRPLEIPLRLSGASEMCRLVLAHAPREALTEALRQTLQDRASAAQALPLETVVPIDVTDPLASRSDGSTRWHDNPFFVLGLSPESSRADVERAGQKLLALLAIDSSGAKTYPTPGGEMTRTADAVRLAMAELRDPERRLLHELWAHAGTAPPVAAGPPGGDGRLAAWGDSLRALGWRRG